jgi:hypothetical protein
MNKKYLIYFGIGMVLIVGVIMLISAEQTSSWCYQETANVSTACGGYNTGTYNSTYTSEWWGAMYDGNWESMFRTTGYAYINYTKPVNSTKESLWQVKTYVSGASNFLNITLDESCWNYNPSKVILMINVTWESPEYNNKFYCFNGSWNKIYTSDLGTMGISEEAMYWNVTTGEPDVVLPSLHISLTGTNNHLKLSGTNNRLNIRNQT